MKKSDERRFTDVVDTINNAENDVDKVLKAARLERNEGGDRHLTAEQKSDLIMSGMLFVGCLLALGLLLCFPLALELLG